MTPRYVLDTNICIYLMKHQPPQVAARFAQCRRGDVAISAITYLETMRWRGPALAAHQAATADVDAVIAPVSPVAPGSPPGVITRTGVCGASISTTMT